MKTHHYFTINTYDKMYTQLKRSKKLDWNAKALIAHIINWQEKINTKTGKQLECTQGNNTIAEDLGIPSSTLNKLITRLGKMKPKFFKATPIPTKRASGGYYNGTKKTIDMELLVQFLSDETEHQSQEVPAKDSNITEGVILHDTLGILSEEVDKDAINVRNELKSRFTKEEAFDKLTLVLEEDVHNIFIDSDEAIEFWLRNNLMARNDISYQEIIAYTEWINDFMTEAYTEMKKNFQKMKAAA